MTGWQTTSLGEISTLISRGVAPKYVESGGIAVLNQKCVRDHTVNTQFARRHDNTVKQVRADRLVQIGDVLVNSTGTGTLGRVGFVSESFNEPTTVDTHVTIVRPKPDTFIPKFFGYMMVSIEDQLKAAGVGTSGQTELSRTSIENDFQVCFPTNLAEQQRIVGILDQAFEGIAKAKTNAERNLANAKELFESELNTLFEDYPSDWNVSPLGDVCKFVGGSQPPKSTFIYEPREGHVRLLQIRDYKSDSKAVYIPKELARRHCEEHDIMIGRYGPPLFQIMRGKSGAYNVALMKALPDTEIISRDFLFYFLRNRNILNYIEETADRTAGQTGFNKERLEAYSIPYPTSDRQLDVVERLQDAETYSASLAAIYGQKIDSLNYLKASLLHQAFSGNL